MATTKIWDVRTHISKLLAYVAKTSKTTVQVESSFDKSAWLAAEILGQYIAQSTGGIQAQG